jgi:hypothetical protein
VKPSEEDADPLILDNHISHCILDAVIFCREIFITLLCIPPNASHMIQAIDRVFLTSEDSLLL